MKNHLVRILGATVAAGISVAAGASVEGGAGAVPRHCESTPYPMHSRAAWRGMDLRDAERDAWWAERRRRVESRAARAMQFPPGEPYGAPHPVGAVPGPQTEPPIRGAEFDGPMRPHFAGHYPGPMPGAVGPWGPVAFVPGFAPPFGVPGAVAGYPAVAPGQPAGAPSAEKNDPAAAMKDEAKAAYGSAPAAAAEPPVAADDGAPAGEGKLAMASLDKDQDGVADERDLCPGTNAGAAVDDFGCRNEAPIVLRGVNFVTDSDELTPESAGVLDAVATTLKSNPEVRVALSGYTDTEGDADYNRDLSQRRANSVKAYLVLHGVAADNLEATGYGEENPIASNDTPEGKASNRRVEMTRLGES